MARERPHIRLRDGGDVGPSPYHYASFKPLLKRTGLPEMRFHDYRHTCATLLLSIVVYKAAGMSGDLATYLMRSLLSEGRIRYETVEKTSDGM